MGCLARGDRFPDHPPRPESADHTAETEHGSPDEASSAWSSENSEYDFNNDLDALNDLVPDSFKQLSSERLAVSSSPGPQASGERGETSRAGVLAETPEFPVGAGFPQVRNRPGHVRSHTAPAIIISEHREGDLARAGIGPEQGGRRPQGHRSSGDPPGRRERQRRIQRGPAVLSAPDDGTGVPGGPGAAGAGGRRTMRQRGFQRRLDVLSGRGGANPRHGKPGRTRRGQPPIEQSDSEDSTEGD
jgi:hypothetical protein